MKTSNLVKIGTILILVLTLELAASLCLYAADYSLDITAQNGTVETELISGQEVSQGLYQEGSIVKLIAHADPGYKFAGFSGSIETPLNMRELTMDGDKAVTANFTSTTGAVVNMTESWFTAQGQPPYLLTQANTTYILYNNRTVDTTAFVVGAASVTLDLNGYTVTYGNSQPITVTNGGFEQGEGRNVPGWDLSGAPNAAIAPNTNYLWGNQVLRLTNITATETIISDPIAIPFANHEYAATITPAGRHDTTVVLSALDAVTGQTLASVSKTNIEGGSAAVLQFTPTTTNSIRLRIDVTPAAGQTPTVVLDYVSLTVSRDYGIVASPGYYYFPSHLRNSIIDNIVRNTPGFTLKNGRVFQGQAIGYKSNPLYASGHVGLTVENVEMLARGIDTCGLAGGYNNNLVIRNSTLCSTVDKISSRMENYGLIYVTSSVGNILVEGNHLVDAPQVGITISGDANIVIRNNVIESNTIVPNGYGILLYKMTSFEISGNRITAAAGKSGRGILVDGLGGVVANHGEIFGNYIDVRERCTPENAAGAIPVYALRLRYYGDAQHRGFRVHDNTFIVRTGAPGEVLTASAGRIVYPTNTTGNDLNNIIENNLFKAILETTATTHWARACILDGTGSTCGPLFRNNIFESNDTSLRLGDGEGPAQSGIFLSNILRRSSEGATRNYQSIISGFWTFPVQNIRMIDTRYENGATPAIIWIGSGLKDISIGWLLDATIQNSQAQPLQGATLDIFDKDNTLVFTGTSDNNGKIADIPLITTIYRQEGTNPGVITTDNRTPHHLEVSLAGYDTRTQDITLTESREITLTLGSQASTSRHITAANLDTSTQQDELLIDFGTNGIWTYSTTTNTWNTLHYLGSESIISVNLDSNPTEDLVIDFGNYGIWIYSNNSTWINLHNINPDTVIKADLDSNTLDDLVVDFGQYGIWIYSNNNTWSQLHTLNPDTITNVDLNSDNTDELVIDFGNEGIWVYYPSSKTWNKLHTLNPESITRANIDSDPKEDLIVDFGTNGIWIYSNNSTWTQPHTLNPDSITRASLDSNSLDDLIIDFGQAGIWIYFNNSTWSQLHNLNPDSLTRASLDSDTRDDLVIDFGTNGIWVYYNNNTWVKIHE